MAVADVSLEESGHPSASGRTLGLVSTSICFLLVSIAAGLLLSRHHYLGCVLALGPLLAVSAFAVAVTDTPRNRVRSLIVTASIGAAAVATVDVWGGRAVSLLLVPAAIAGVLIFSAEDVEGGDERWFRTLGLSPIVCGVIALGPAFAGGFLLIDQRDLTGSGLAALLLAPWIFFAPTAWLLVDEWGEHVAARHRAAREQMKEEAPGETHSFYGEGRMLIVLAQQEARRLQASDELSTILENAWEAATAADQEAMRLMEAETSALEEQLRPRAESPTDQVGIPDEVGIPTGNTNSEVPSLDSPMRASVDMRLPTWVPGRMRPACAHVFDVVGPSRELTSPLIVEISLYLTLWLRAGILLGAPSLAYLTFSPDLPSRYASRSIENLIWLVIAFWSLAVAMVAPVVSNAVRQRNRQRFRDALLVIETPMAIALLVAKPSWPTAVFVAGLFLWSQRPDFEARNLFVCVALIVISGFVGICIHWDQWSITTALSELVIALVVTLAIASSYGLMFPLVFRAAVEIPVRLYRERTGIERKVYRAVAHRIDTALSNSEGVLRNLLDQHSDDKELQKAIARLQRGRQRLRRPPGPFGRLRHAHNFKAALELSISDVEPVTIEGVPDDGALYRWEVEVEPPALERGMVSYRVERLLRNALRRIVEEANAHGEGKLVVKARLDDDGVEVSVSNGFDPEHQVEGHGKGKDIIQRAVERLPKGALLWRDPVPAPPFPYRPHDSVYKVVFRFDADTVAINKREAHA